MDRYYVKFPLLVFMLRLDHYDLCVVRQLWLVINDVLWYQFCYVSQKRYFWDCDVRHNGHHLDLKIQVLTPIRERKPAPHQCTVEGELNPERAPTGNFSGRREREKREATKGLGCSPLPGGGVSLYREQGAALPLLQEEGAAPQAGPGGPP